MYQSEPFAVRRNPLAGALKAALPAAAFALCMAGASASHATAIFLQSSEMNQQRTARITGPGGFYERVYIAPMLFTANVGTSAGNPAFEFLAFCVDIFHRIDPGVLNLKYDDDADLTTDSNNIPLATLLTADQVTHVAQLANYGQLLFANAADNAQRAIKLAGLQGAIWEVINTGYDVDSTVAVDAYIDLYGGAGYQAALTGYGPVGSSITFIKETGLSGTAAAHQAFVGPGDSVVPGGVGVPEPATWALMIMGFGGAGAMLRRSRRTRLSVA